jgi:hypothetical protein
MIALMPAAVSAQSAGRVVIGGLGTASCGNWTAARRERSEGHACGYEQWLLGYVSGLAMGRAHPDAFDPLNGIDSLGVWAWVGQREANPDKTIEDAAFAFVSAHLQAN